MSGPPPPPPPPPPPIGRPRTTPSPPPPPLHPSPPPGGPTPRPRGPPYRTYYRGGPVTPQATPVLGWTPRNPAAPHTPVARGALASRAAVAATPRHPPIIPPQPLGSPRASISTTVGKSGTVKPAVPIPIASPVIAGAQTPSWLKGGYQHRQPTPTVTQPTTVESWCKDRLENIKATVEGRSDTVPELRKVMDDLDYVKVGDEIALIGSIRKEYWKAKERQRKALMDLHRAEREVQRINSHSAHINGKIARLRGYARFIEGGWKDESELDNHIKPRKRAEDDKGSSPSTNNPDDHKSNENSNGKRTHSENNEIEPSKSSDERYDRPKRRSSEVEMQSS